MDTNQTHPGNPVNEPQANVPTKSSRINLIQTRGQTHRFGEYSVHMVMDTIKKDVLPYRHDFDLRSYSLKAPLMQNIQMRNDYFNVPMEAILPFNWEIITANPTFGDDVPDECNTTVVNFPYKIKTFLKNWHDFNNTQSTTQNWGNKEECWTAWLQWTLVMEMFYSHGNMFAELGCKLAQFFTVNDLDEDGNYEVKSADYFINTLLEKLKGSFEVKFYKEDGTYESYAVENNATTRTIRYRDFLEKARQNLYFEITTGYSIPLVVDEMVDAEETLINALDNAYGINITYNWLDTEIEIKLERLWAYQLVCAHFYSNDQIDAIYSADQYRKLISYYIEEQKKNFSTLTKTFTYNGIELPYDWLSAHFFTEMLKTWNNDILTDKNVLWYFNALLSHRRSLRKIDYFTGGRTLPQAVADTNVAVISNQVSAIDITKGIQMQRYANAVQRFGRKIEEYLEGLFPGQKVAYDYHNPAFLAHTNDTVYGEEVENTAADQQSNSGFITSNLRSNASRYCFEFNPDRPGVILGITYFDIERLYTHVIERDFFHKDRFEEFNPMMQYIGDQPIYVQEIGAGGNGRAPFAYTIRYMEYKQMISEAIGGAVENLPGWYFKDRPNNINIQENAYIGSDFIRSKSWELDQYYSDLTGLTLSNYFHFNIKHINAFNARRPMAYNPGIL